MSKQLEEAIRHIKTRADAWAVKEVTEALQSISERLDKALSQINDIKAIINNPMYIQEDVLRYQMICEVFKE